MSTGLHSRLLGDPGAPAEPRSQTPWLSPSLALGPYTTGLAHLDAIFLLEHVSSMTQTFNKDVPTQGGLRHRHDAAPVLGVNWDSLGGVQGAGSG